MTADANITYGFEANGDDEDDKILPITAGNISWVLLMSRALHRAPHAHLPVPIPEGEQCDSFHFPDEESEAQKSPATVSGLPARER